MAPRGNVRQIRATNRCEAQNCTENSAWTDYRKMSWPQSRKFHGKKTTWHRCCSVDEQN